MTRMKDVDHTNPNDPRNVFGELFRRGPSVVTDGGEAADEEERTPMKDVSHTASDEDRNANRVWSRGSEDEVREAE